MSIIQSSRESRQGTPPLEISPTAPTSRSIESSSSTPPAFHGSSRDDSPSDLRALSVYDTLVLSHRIWVEFKPSMINQLLTQVNGNYHSLATEVSGVPEMAAFEDTEGCGSINEREFGDLVTAITMRLDRSPEKPIIKYVRTGDSIIFSRIKGRPRDSRFGLKPDFFTSSVQLDDSPLSISTILGHPAQALDTTNSPNLRRSARVAGQTLAPTGNKSNMLKNSGYFCWEDLHVIWEIKSSPNKLNSPKAWGNLTLKATEVLRFQWHRQFILGFLVCGTKMRMFRFSRSGVLVSLPVDFRATEGRLTLAKCILAPLVLPHTAVGFTIDPHNPRTINVDGKLHLIIRVQNNDFVLGDQIVIPRRDLLVSRATTTHMARRMEDREWSLCYKSSWPYEARDHEGDILKSLRDVEGVVRVVAWDAAAVAHSAFTVSHIQDNFHPHEQTSHLSSKHESTRSPEEVLGHARQYRQTVTDYLPESIASRQLSPLELLQVWRSLYLVVDAIAERGWVHRDLSWSNVRLVYGGGSWSVTLIDFDLAAPIVGTSTGSPDKTGTPIFMPIQILKSRADVFCRHQELHEDESAFWIGFLAFVHLSADGQKQYEWLGSLNLTALAGCKADMLSATDRTLNWPAWFGKTDQMRLVSELLGQIIQLQLSRGPLGIDFIYPPAEQLNDRGQRTHFVQHKLVLESVVAALETAIDRLSVIDEEETLLSMRELFVE